MSDSEGKRATIVKFIACMIGSLGSLFTHVRPKPASAVVMSAGRP